VEDESTYLVTVPITTVNLVYRLTLVHKNRKPFLSRDMLQQVVRPSVCL